MGKIKDFIIRIIREVGREYTRIDRTCNACGRECFGGTGTGESLFCKDCYEHLPLNKGDICSRCGRSSVEPVVACESCSGEELPFDLARSSFYYAPPIDGMIRNLKYDNRRYLARVLSPFMAETAMINFSDADVMTFIPMPDKAKKRRGYNQAELLAESVSEITGVAVVNALVKDVDTDRQARLNRSERKMNLKGAIKVRNKALVAGKRVIVVDDVMTTGATAETAAAALKKAGADKVYVLTAASVTDARTARLLGQERSVSAVRREKRNARLIKKLERQRKRAERTKGV
ncbi:MAG: ComF family protein [Clostridia bacterium]|nr:ComF family protein [Clostridia bacterium]